MAYKFTCPECGQISELNSKPIRQTVICPFCSKDVMVVSAAGGKRKLFAILFTAIALLLGAIFIFIFISVKAQEDQKRRLEEKRRAEAAARLREIKLQEKLEEARRRWKETTKIAERSKLKTEADFVKALSTLKNYPGGDPEEKAKLIKQIQQYKAADIAKIMTTLDSKAKAFGDKKEFLKAVSVYQDYDGDFKLETESLRSKGAIAYFDLEEKHKKQVAAEKRETEEAKQKLVNDLAGGLIGGKISQSLAGFKSSPLKNELPEVNKIVDNLSNINEIILDSFKPQIGKEIPVALKKGKASLKIKKVEKGRLYAEFKKSNLTMIKKYSVKDLDDSEVMKRLIEYDKATANVMAGVKAVRRKSYDQAEKYFQASGELGIPLTAKLGEYKASRPAVEQEEEQEKQTVLVPVEARKIKVSLRITKGGRTKLDMGERLQKITARLDVYNTNQQPIDGYVVTVIIIGRSLVYKDEYKPIYKFSKELKLAAKGKMDKDIPITIHYNDGAEIYGNEGSGGLRKPGESDERTGPSEVIPKSGYRYYSWLWVLQDPEGEIKAKKSKQSKFEKTAKDLLEEEVVDAVKEN